MNKKILVGLIIGSLLLFSCMRNIVNRTVGLPGAETVKASPTATADALSVPGFKYIYEKYKYGLEGKYQGGEYVAFEELPNFRETADYYILELKKDDRPLDLYGYVVELADAAGKVYDFRCYTGKPAFLAVKKDGRVSKLILYSVKLNGNYFEKGLYLSQSYWDHVIVKDALAKAKLSLRIYSEKELLNSYEESGVPVIKTNELLAEKQRYIWKLVALRWGEEDLPFIYVDIHDSSIYVDDEKPSQSVRKRYDYYSPGWYKGWTKQSVVYGILCEVPKAGFNDLFIDKSYIDRPKKPVEKKNPKDVELTHFFQVIF